MSISVPPYLRLSLTQTEHVGSLGHASCPALSCATRWDDGHTPSGAASSGRRGAIRGHGGTACDPRAIASSRPRSRTGSHGHPAVTSTKAPTRNLRWSEHYKLVQNWWSGAGSNCRPSAFRLARKAQGCSTIMVRAKCGSARDRFSSAVSPMWCQRPGVTQRKTVRPGRLHQHVSVQPQRRRGPPIPSASAARVPTASRRTPATPPRRIRRIPASLVVAP